MALRHLSSFLYGLEVTPNNSSIDFRSVSLGPEKNATLTVGFYSLSALMIEVKRALEAADPLNTYTVTADRTIAGGTQNRVSISTSGAYLDLLFLTGSRTASNSASLLGFNVSNYTGSTLYTGFTSSGTLFIPNMVAYNFLPTTVHRKNFGTVNVTASGIKETIVYATQYFFQAQFKYIPESQAFNEWASLMTWMIAQKGIDFTPDITAANTFYDATLESTSADGKGLAYKMTEMLPSFPFTYDTGLLNFRIRSS